MTKPRIYADFHNADAQGRLRLNTVGTLEDLSAHRVTMRENLELTLYSEDLQSDGVVQYSADENLWVAVIDWDAIQHSPTAKEQEEPV